MRDISTNDIEIAKLYAELEYARIQLKEAQYNDQKNHWHSLIKIINLEIAEITGKMRQNKG